MFDIDKVVEILEKSKQPKSEFVKLMDDFKSPYIVLISCILSLRTKDQTTYPATLRMLKLAKTPQEMMNVKVEDLERAIYPVGFYKNKAKQIIELSKELVEKYNGKVPCDIDELCKFKGVGRKTANLICGDIYGKPAVVTDTHFIRISNRLGFVNSENPLIVEREMRKILPPDESNDFCHRIVLFGRDTCKAINPKCNDCILNPICKKKIKKKAKSKGKK